MVKKKRSKGLIIGIIIGAIFLIGILLLISFWDSLFGAKRNYINSGFDCTDETDFCEGIEDLNLPLCQGDIVEDCHEGCVCNTNEEISERVGDPINFKMYYIVIK